VQEPSQFTNRDFSSKPCLEEIVISTQQKEKPRKGNQKTSMDLWQYLVDLSTVFSPHIIIIFTA
jgi:hypothetical protein